MDGIYTHFPADEDKTLDLGRLGEECNRTYKVRLAPPEGISHAKDIAMKYGVTFEQLTE